MWALLDDRKVVLMDGIRSTKTDLGDQQMLVSGGPFKTNSALSKKYTNYYIH